MKRFHLRDILAVTAGLTLGAEYFTGLQELYDYVYGDSPEAKKKNLLQQFPQLASCGDDLSQDDLRIVKAGTDKEQIAQILERWINRQTAIHGEYLQVKPSPIVLY